MEHLSHRVFVLLWVYERAKVHEYVLCSFLIYSPVATDRGITPAHVAAQKGSINCLRVLFDAGTQIQVCICNTAEPVVFFFLQQTGGNLLL